MSNVENNEQTSTSLTPEQLKVLEKNIQKGIKDIGSNAIKLRDSIQNTAFMCLKLSFNKRDCTSINQLMNALNTHVKSVRAESVGYWFKEVGGMDCRYVKETNSFSTKFDKHHKSVLGIEFTYDNMHLRACTNEKLFYYQIAPVEYKELKLPETLDKAFAGSIGNVAKMQALGMVDDDAILTYLNSLISKIHAKKADKATKEWIEKFQAQKSEETKVESEVENTAEVETVA